MTAYFDKFRPLLLPFAYKMRVPGLRDLVESSGAEEWHRYAVESWHKRNHVCLACDWIRTFADKKGKVFEAGCGGGANLLWLAKRGFGRLFGSDISAAAISLGRALADRAGVSLRLWRDDALKPAFMPGKIDTLLSVNWLYHLPGASLDAFFELYRPFLVKDARIVFDMVDSSYNHCANNEWHTDDGHLPEESRRPSEYKLRLSREEIRAILRRHGMRELRCARAFGSIPRTVWLAAA